METKEMSYKLIAVGFMAVLLIGYSSLILYYGVAVSLSRGFFGGISSGLGICIAMQLTGLGLLLMLRIHHKSKLKLKQTHETKV
ncbi:hypothetical protein [Candidatus Bathycorpusculum sp.]|jgi:hypothetical protein|uniref:hypothetical protein n=1 Tax=Candidatus Bathycorpusculum sp. TaxID=2994959 RepID=UPI00281DAF04|nr:hypothetical protein [Candidatus Termitimicrobium sp.]MCL2685731.1 hypothetical protein [Candidatus Termitimicrobium sp.]